MGMGACTSKSLAETESETPINKVFELSAEPTSPKQITSNRARHSLVFPPFSDNSVSHQHSIKSQVIIIFPQSNPDMEKLFVKFVQLHGIAAEVFILDKNI